MSDSFKTNIVFLLAAFAITTVTLPALAAYRAGTDEYLRQELGFSEELSEGVQTDDREPFPFAKEGSMSVEDPLGDVLSRVGTTSSLQKDWGDIERADTIRDEANKQWIVRVLVGGKIPRVAPNKGQLFVYVDRDRDSSNNESVGVRGQMDAEYSIVYDPQKKWTVEYRWYNLEEDFWAFPPSKATMDVEQETFVLRIPFEEITGDVFPNWRVVMAVASSTDTQVDVAPGEGFPPPIGTSYKTKKENLIEYVILGTVLLAIAGAGVLIYRKRKV